MAKMKVEQRGGKPDLIKLAQPSEHHPKGRIQLEAGKVVGVPENNVIRVNKKKIYHESGMELGTIEIPIMGGHAKSVGSVWRVGLTVSKHHKRVLEQAERFARKGDTKDRTVVELTPEEHKEYMKYLEFLKEKGEEISTDEKFYKWMKKV